MKKHTYGFIKQQFENEWYELLDGTYNGANIPMIYTCPNHPSKLIKISYNNLKRGSVIAL